MKVQARITLPTDVRREIDRLRLAWDPEHATDNPAHVTVAYQDEAPDPAVLAERVRLAASKVGRFRLMVGPAERFPAPALGAFLRVVDPTGGVAVIRDEVLAPPFTRRARFGLHITLLHPDKGERLVSAWPAFVMLPSAGSFEVTEIEMVGPNNAVLSAFPLVETERC